MSIICTVNLFMHEMTSWLPENSFFSFLKTKKNIILLREKSFSRGLIIKAVILKQFEEKGL